MKILYFIRDISDCGGIQQTTCHIINSLISNCNEYDISTVSLYNKKNANFFELNSKVKQYRLFEKVIDTRIQYFQIKGRLNSLLLKICPDIIVVQGIAYSNYISKKMWSLYKVIVCEHGHYYMGSRFGLHWFGKKTALRNASAIVTLTDLDKYNYETNNRKGIIIKTIYNPCVLHNDCCIKYNINSKTIVSCGSLDKLKRFDHIILSAENVLKKHPDWSFNIYGDGSERLRLEKIIREYKLEDKIIIKGYENDKRIIYGDKSFFIMTSTFEGFGMVLLEAMQHKLPIISYNINYGPKEIIENGVNGFLVESGNIDLLSERISGLIEDVDKRQMMSDRAYKSLSRFDEETIINQWIDLFEELA